MHHSNKAQFDRGVLRVGLIGIGNSGSTFHAPLIRAVRGLELAAVVNRGAQKLPDTFAEAIEYRDAESLLEDDSVDIVVIATPNNLHAPLSEAAIRAGKHVVVDKPFALNLDEARALIGKAAEVNRHIWVFQNRRWDSDFLSIANALDEQLIGRVVHFESRMDRFRPVVQQRWRDDGRPGSGILYDLGPHLIDQALQLFGLPSNVSCHLARQRDGSKSDDWMHLVLEFGDMHAVLQAGMLAASAAPRFAVHGTLGSLVKQESDRQESQLQLGLSPVSFNWGMDPDPVLLYQGGTPLPIPIVRGAQESFYERIVEQLKYGGRGPVSSMEALAVMAVMDAARESARQGVRIAPGLTSEEVGQWQ